MSLRQAQTTPFPARCSFRLRRPCGCASGSLTPRQPLVYPDAQPGAARCARLGVPLPAGSVQALTVGPPSPSPSLHHRGSCGHTSGGYSGSLWFQRPFALHITSAFLWPTTNGEWEAEELSGCTQWEALAGRRAAQGSSWVSLGALPPGRGSKLPGRLRCYLVPTLSASGLTGAGRAPRPRDAEPSLQGLVLGCLPPLSFLEPCS